MSNVHNFGAFFLSSCSDVSSHEIYDGLAWISYKFWFRIFFFMKYMLLASKFLTHLFFGCSHSSVHFSCRQSICFSNNDQPTSDFMLLDFLSLAWQGSIWGSFLSNV